MQLSFSRNAFLLMANDKANQTINVGVYMFHFIAAMSRN